MATSGSVTVKVTSYDTLVFRWDLTSQSIEDNSSVVSWTMSLVAGSSGAITSNVQKAWTVVVNGNTYKGTASHGIGNNQTKVLARGSTTIPHNNDGSKTFAFSFKQVFKGLVFSGENVPDMGGSGNGTLPTIARASAPSCITWPEHTQNVGDFGDTISIHMNRKADTFTHTVRYKFGDNTGTIATGVTNGTTWTIPLSLMNLIPNNTSGSGMIYVDTYSGSTLVGTGSCGFTATVPASVKPTVTLTLADVTGVEDTYGSPVQLLSKIKVTAKGTSAYSSPIQSYAITANGAAHTGKAEITTDVLKASGAQTFSVTVKDSRGRSGTASLSKTVLAYAFPSISKLTVRRCNSDGTENDQGDYVKATLSAAITSLNSKNTTTYTLRYKKTSASSWTSAVLTALNGNYAPANKSHVFAADSNSSYDVELEVADRHGTATRSTSVSTAFTLINWGEAGTNIAFGKVAEILNSVQVGLKFYDEYGTRIGNGVAVYGSSDAPIDANTTMEHVFLTTLNTPTTAFWYVFQVFYNSKSDTGNRAQFAIPYSVKGPIYHRFKYGNSWSAWMTHDDAVDTGWISAVSLLKSGFAQHSAQDPPVYRKVGKTVRLSGAVTPTATVTGSESETTIYTLPTGYRPAASCYSLCQGSGNAIWLCGVTKDGAVTFSRHRDATITNKYAYANTGASEWLKFDVTFFID